MESSLSQIEYSQPEIAQARDVLALQREKALKEEIASLSVRQERLDRLLQLLIENQDALCAAVNLDFGQRSATFTRAIELMSTCEHIRYNKKMLKGWMKPERRRADPPFSILGARAEIRYQPLGVVGIISPWNAPISLSFGGAVDAIAAGNRVMLKPSEHTPNTSALMQELVEKYFDRSEFAVVVGGTEASIAFSKLPFDHLLYTGSTEIGKSIMAAAAEHLVPVTLELGGKCPVVIGRSADIEDAAFKVIAARSMNAGQVCLSPDFVSVHESQFDAFVATCKRVFENMYPDFDTNGDYVSIINERHRDRILGLIAASGDAAVPLAAFSGDGRRVPLHLVLNPDDSAPVMRSEIFGPILPVVKYTDLDHVIKKLNAREAPLAMYIFSGDSTEIERLLGHTRSGGVTVNDIALHAMTKSLPFGGVGHSGMGRYMGGDSGFKGFSNCRTVFYQQKMYKGIGKLFFPPYGKLLTKILNSRLSR